MACFGAPPTPPAAGPPAERDQTRCRCRGVFDWLTAVSWRLAAFSTCGTDFPLDRLGWLAGADVVFGVLDADRAGREASGRLGATFGARWRPIALPDGSDLNDLGQRRDGRALFFNLVAAAGDEPMERG